MRNLFRQFACGAAIVLVFSLCAGGNRQGRRLLSEEELQWLSDRNNTILIAPSADYPPVSFIDEKGAFDGISSDYLEILERKIGVKFHIVGYVNQKEAMTAMEARAIDGISAVVRSPGGSADLLFSEPYVESPAIILTRQSTREKVSLETLGNLMVGVAEGYGVEDIISARYPDIHLVMTANNLQGIRDLSEGRIDAFITDLKVASHYIEREGIANLRVAGETGFTYTISFGCSKGEPILADILNKGLSLITEAERYAVEQRWGSVLAIPSSGQYWNAAFVFIGFGLAAALFIFFLLRPDRAIRQRGAVKTGKGRLRKALRVFIVYYWPVYTILLLAVALTLGIYFSSLVEDRALTSTEREWLDKNGIVSFWASIPRGRRSSSSTRTASTADFRRST
jgi:ABC-type amino acid transport substrate-binding protein